MTRELVHSTVTQTQLVAGTGYTEHGIDATFSSSYANQKQSIYTTIEYTALERTETQRADVGYGRAHGSGIGNGTSPLEWDGEMATRHERSLLHKHRNLGHYRLMKTVEGGEIKQKSSHLILISSDGEVQQAFSVGV